MIIIFQNCFNLLVGHLGLLVDGVPFLQGLPEALVAHDHGVHDGVVVVGVLVLLQNGHPLGGVNGDGTLGGFQFPGEDPQERGLACTVGTDNTVAVAGQKL